MWLGEHHNSAKDHVIQVEMIRKLHDLRRDDAPMAIGLEQVQVQYQPALDDYIAGNIDLQQIKELVQWETRWTWPFDQYRPIFETAHQLGIRLVALNVDSEDLALVEKDGFPGLGRSQLEKYISDPYVNDDDDDFCLSLLRRLTPNNRSCSFSMAESALLSSQSL